MIRAVLACALATGFLATTATAATRPFAPDWIVTPGDDSCRTEFDLTGRSGKTVQASLVSDGDRVTLAFPQEDPAERAFVPIRIDQKPFSNLVRRTESGKVGLMVLGDETLAALRKGSILQIAWLAEEPVSVSLTGSERAIADLKTCGAQVAAQFRARQAAQRDEQARIAADNRAIALANEQLAAAKAQTAAAEAERQRVAAEAERLQAAADADRQREAYEAQRQANYQRQQAQAYEDDWAMQPAQDYDPRPYRYRRYYPYGE